MTCIQHEIIADREHYKPLLQSAGLEEEFEQAWGLSFDEVARGKGDLGSVSMRTLIEEAVDEADDDYFVTTSGNRRMGLTYRIHKPVTEDSEQ